MAERIVPKTPALAEREQKAIEDLRALFPDGNVAGLDGKDKALGKRLSKLYRSLGYESRADMIAALGFRQDPDNRGGHPVTADPEALFDELQRRYEGEPKPPTLGLLKHDNPDLAGMIKTVSNKCPEFYGHTITVELVARGLLDKRHSREGLDEILQIIDMLEEKYANDLDRPKTLAELKQREPDYAEALQALYADSRRATELFGMSLVRHLRSRGIIGVGITDSDGEGLATVLDALQEFYSGKPNDDKPNTVAALVKAHPEFADVLEAAQKARRLSKDALMERGILGLSQAALKARAKVLKERCVRNARVSELARMYAGSGGAELVLPGERVDYLRPGVVGVDLKYRYELREVAVTALDANLVVGDVLKPFHSVSSGWYNRGQLELFKGEACVTHIERPAEDDFLTSKTYVDPTPLKEFEGAEVIGLETVAGRQLARIHYRFLSIISRETLLYALYRMGALDDAELYANDDSWRARLEQLPEEPFRGDTPHAGVAAASSGSDAQAAPDEQVVGLEELLPLPEEQGNLSLAESASHDGGVIAGAGAVAEELGAEQPEPSEIPLAVHDEDMDGNGPELALDDEAGLSEGAPVPDGWTFERHQLAVGRRFSVEVPDQWVLTPDENGRPLARYEKGVDEESEYPQIICSAMAGDLDEETQATLRENVIPEARIQLSRKAIYGNDMANTLSRVVNDWVVEGKNCQVLVFEILMPSIFPGFTSDSYEYHVKPIAYDHEDFLRLTDSWGHLGEGRLKELAFAIAPTVELDGPVELRRLTELEQYCEEPADADAFCTLVGVISNMLNLSGSERTNANLWREIRRSNNDKNCLMVAGTMPRIQAEAYNASLDDEVAYYGRLVTALERQHELPVDGFGKMWKLVGEFGDVRVVDHVTMEDDEEAAKAVNSLGIISIPASYQALHKRWEALAPEVVQGVEESAEQNADEAARLQEEEAAQKAEAEAKRRMQDARIELNGAKGRLDSLTRDKEKLEAQIQEFDRQISDIRATARDLKRTETDLDAARKELDGLGFFAFGKKGELRKRIQQLEQSQKELSEKLPSDVDEFIKRIGRQRDDVTSELGEVEKRLAECRKRIDASASILVQPLVEKLAGASKGNVLEFGSYPQSSDRVGGEPVKWQVLEKRGDRLLLMSTLVLDYHVFNESKVAGNDYQTSDLRKWMIDALKTRMFGVDEQLLLDGDPFIMGLKDFTHYFTSKASRMCSQTEYAKGRGRSKGGRAFYWLSTAGDWGEGLVYYVNPHGDILGSGKTIYSQGMSFGAIGLDVNYDSGVRPAIWVKTKA